MVPSDLEEDEIADYLSDKYGWLVIGFVMGAEETFEAPYGGAGALMDIGKETPLADFTGKELAESSAIHGDFDQASLNYSGHQNLEVRAEDYEGPMTHAGAKDYVNALESKIDGAMKDEGFFPAEYEDFKEVVVEEIENHTEYSPWHEQGIPTHHDYQNAEMEQLTKTVADVSNRFDESLGQIEVDDIDGDIDDIENVVLRIKDPMGDVVDEVTIDSDAIPDDWDDYLAESKTPSLTDTWVLVQ